jgi:hypothetical protein
MACGLAVANANYLQPLLLDIGASLHLTDGGVSLRSASTQVAKLTKRISRPDTARAHARVQWDATRVIGTMVKLPQQFSRK